MIGRKLDILEKIGVFEEGSCRKFMVI